MLPTVNTEAMNLHLAEISTQITPGAHAVITLDGAGWHQTGGELKIPHNVTAVVLAKRLAASATFESPDEHRLSSAGWG